MIDQKPVIAGLRTLLVGASISTLVACGAQRTHVERPGDAVDAWNQQVESGDCAGLTQQLHPATYGAGARERFLAYCEQLSETQRISELSVASSTLEPATAELSGPADAGVTTLEQGRSGWVIRDFGGAEESGMTPMAVLSQLQELANSDVLRRTLDVMHYEVRDQYVAQLRALGEAIEMGRSAQIEMSATHARVIFDTVTVVMSRGDNGRWYFDALQ